jgi:hypothetical protein
MLRPAVLAATATLCATPVAAQTPAPPATAPAGAFVFSAGTDALGRDFGDATPGLAAHAGYERRIGGARSPLALRVAGDYWRTGRTFTGRLHDGLGPLDVRRTTTLVGASLLGVARLPAVGALRPYAVAGVGVQQYSNRNESDWVPLDSRSASKVVYLPPVRVNTMAYTAGVGASARVGRVTPFAEARVMVLPGVGSTGVQGVRAPLTMGLRF